MHLRKGKPVQIKSQRGVGREKTQPNTLSQWPLPKKSLNIHPPAGPLPLPRILFVHSSLLKLGASPRHGKQELRLGRGDASAEPTAALGACVCIILYITHSGKTFPYEAADFLITSTDF